MIYFDNSATTKPSRACIAAVTEAMERRYANASSLHREGVSAKGDIDGCRAALALRLGCNTSEILLTPGGTFGNNLAVKTAVEMQKRRGNRIVISSVEHPSVSACVKTYENAGFEVVLCNPLNGDFEKNINDKTILVSCMYVNNETGLILPVEKLAGLIESSGAPALLHIDAVQALGKLPVDVCGLGCDMLTVSAHKINGPKGVGALYVRRGVRVSPLTYGGEQENSLVPGTYNSPACAGFAAALHELGNKDAQHLKNLYGHFVMRAREFDFIRVNTFGEHSPHIINITFDGYLGENVLHYLEEFGIYTSQGSACSSHSKKKSRALEALGADKRTADCSLRISFDFENTIAEIDEFFKVCTQIPQNLIRCYK